MRLYSARIPVVARDIIQQLTAANDIEVSNADEAQLDIESVLREYLRLDRELTERAKDTMESRNLAHGHFGKIKRALAEEKGLGMGEEGITWMCNQILETFMHSPHIDEIFSTDAEMRRRMREILHRHMMADDEIDEQVRQRIKNLNEHTDAWDIEYARAMEQIKRKRGLT